MRRISWHAAGLSAVLLVSGLVGTIAAPAVAEPPAATPPAGAPAEAPGPRTTPQLLEDAVARGELDQASADLFLAYAFGTSGRLPAAFRSTAPWDGTVPLLQLQQRVERMPVGPRRSEILREIAAAAPPAAPTTATCSSSNAPLLNTFDTTHFHIAYSTIGGGLSINEYAASLESSWTTEVIDFGWAAPPVKLSNPPPGNRYHVRIDALGPGLYGFVSSSGTYAGAVGDNPNTAWNDLDAQASCMVLNRDYTGFPGSPQRALDSTTAHELNHSLQYGYGALNGANVPDSAFIEGGATWMEDEAMDAADDNWNYLWPNFADSLGDYDASPYAYWITFRGMTERYGAGVPGGGEDVMQRFWEETSRGTGNNVSALATALAAEGTTVADAFHAYAIAVKFNRTCGGGYTYPYCFEEAAGYVSSAGPTVVHRTIAAAGASVTGTIEDDYSLNWVRLPAGAGSYPVTLTNTSSGGSLRGSVVCDTGSTLTIAPLPAVVGAGASTTLSAFDSTGCTAAVAVLTNQAQSPGNPSNSAQRSYSLATGGGGGTGTLSIADASTAEGNAGQSTISFPVTLSVPSSTTVTVAWATAPNGKGQAAAGVDYVSSSGTVTFAPNDTSEAISVTVNGDTANEPNETFLVQLSNAVGATIADPTAVGTIVNDDGGGGGGSVTLSIADATVTEGNSGTTVATFVVSLSAASSSTVTVGFASANGSAVAPGDYTAVSGSLSFSPGQTSRSITVTVFGDTALESTETFVVNLSKPIGATIADGQGVGTIVNDD